MRQRLFLKNASFIFLVILIAGCSCLHKERQAKELEVPLMKLTPAAQAIVLWPENGPVPDDQIFNEAVKDKPELQAAFQGIPVKAKSYGKNVVVLVCSPGGGAAWLEDASWTPGIDKKWYEIDESHPCVFSLVPPTEPASSPR